MRLISLHARGFRSFEDVDIPLAPHSVLVGENNVGKSSVALAVERILGASPLNNPKDRRINSTLEPYLELRIADVAKVLVETVASIASKPEQRELKSLIEREGDEFTIEARYRQAPVIRFGNFFLRGQYLSYGQPIQDKHFPSADFAVATRAGPNQIAASLSLGTWDIADASVYQRLFDELRQRFRHFREFRERIEPQGSAAMASYTGLDTADVLFNLRTHPRSAERSRYAQIIDTFKSLFPLFHVEAVSQEPGARKPEVQFYLPGTELPLELDQMSAGIHQVLTLLTNLIGQEGLILFIEHPEQHLHPHGMRFLSRILTEASAENQVIVATHDPNFLPASLDGVVRFSWQPTHQPP